MIEKVAGSAFAASEHSMQQSRTIIAAELRTSIRMPTFIRTGPSIDIIPLIREQRTTKAEQVLRADPFEPTAKAHSLNWKAWEIVLGY